jgi:hypothetical protein
LKSINDAPAADCGEAGMTQSEWTRSAAGQAFAGGTARVVTSGK